MSDAQGAPAPATQDQINQALAHMLAQQVPQQPAPPAVPMQPQQPQMMPAMQMQQPMVMQPQMMPAGQMAGAAPAPQAILFRMSIPLPDGTEASAYLSFPASSAPNPQALQMLAQQVAMAWPIATFQPRNRGWGNNGGGRGGWNGNGGGGGYGGGRGGWRRGGW